MSDSDSTSPTKTCTMCGRALPATLEYFHHQGNGKYGLKAICKPCAHQRLLEWRKANPEKSKAIGDRYEAAHKAERLAANRKYREEHRDELSVKRHQRLLDNYEAHKARWATYYRANAAEVRQKQKIYRAVNRQRLMEYQARYKETHAEEHRASARLWRVRYPQKAHEGDTRKRAQRAAAPGVLKACEIAEQYSRQKGKCLYCGKALKGVYHVDHVVPLVLGGSNSIENIVIACPTCNMSKGGKHPMDFCGRLL